MAVHGSTARALHLTDLSLADRRSHAAERLDRDLEQEVIEGLASSPKRIPCKYLYDERGCALFDWICELPEYYLTRTELQIMRASAVEMAAAIGRDALIIELGSGSGIKTPLLLRKLEQPSAYLPVDIAREHLYASSARLAAQFPGLLVVPLWQDFTLDLRLPRLTRCAKRTVVYFPGSTIGNFGPAEGRSLLLRIARLTGAGGGMLVGVDLRKSATIIEPAYNDSAGITAQFNMNLLARLNRELGGTFDLDRFVHHAFFNEEASRIEMHLVSLADQKVQVGDLRLGFFQGESITTEHSYKYSRQAFAALAESAGMRVVKVWTDPEELFSVQYLEVQERVPAV